MIPSADQLERLFNANSMKRLGIGSRRVCFEIPGTDLCVKCYRSEAEIALGKHVERGSGTFKPLRGSVISEIRRHRFSDRGNTSCQEWRYHAALRTRVPKKLIEVFPDTVERVLVPGRGWCIVESVVRNFDGSPLRKLHEVCALVSDAGLKRRLMDALYSLRDLLFENSVRFYDPQNICVQWISAAEFRLRIVDFEPASRALIPLDEHLPILARLKLRRRFARYVKYHASLASVDRNPASGRVNVLCMKWGRCYTADYVNRLYAGVKRNLRIPFRFVCITDDATGFVPQVEAVPFPDDPHVPKDSGGFRQWPNIFAKLAVFKDGFAGLVGPTLFLDLDLLVTGPLDRFFTYRPGEFCIIHNWLEWRKTLFRRIPDIGNSSCFRFEAGKSNGVWETFVREKADPVNRTRFMRGSQKFQTYAMMKTGRVNWWPSSWVCSFKRRLVPVFPLNKIFAPWRPPKRASVVAFHGEPDIPQALAGYRFKNGNPVRPHLTCLPTKWIADYWHE